MWPGVRGTIVHPVRVMNEGEEEATKRVEDRSMNAQLLYPNATTDWNFLSIFF